MEFHAKEQLPGLLDWMRQQMKACGGKTAVIGISGGKDSSIVAALAVAAYGRENVVGVLMPDGIQPDIDYSNGLVEFLNLRHYVFNIQGGTSAFSVRWSGLVCSPAARPGKSALPDADADAVRRGAERGGRHRAQYLQSLRGLGGLLHGLRRRRRSLLSAWECTPRRRSSHWERSWVCRKNSSSSPPPMVSPV